MAKKGEVLGLIAQIRKAIQESGASLQEVGRKSHVSAAQLSRFMRGERHLSLPAAEKVCEALGWKLAPKARRKK